MVKITSVVGLALAGAASAQITALPVTDRLPVTFITAITKIPPITLRPTITVTLTSTVTVKPPPCSTATVTVKPPVTTVTSVTTVPPSTITAPPSTVTYYPNTPCEPPQFSTLCPDTCVKTYTLKPPKELCPEDYKECPPVSTTTTTLPCRWCPVTKCTTIATTFTVDPCPIPDWCKPVQTATVKCPYPEKPDGLQFRRRR